MKTELLIKFLHFGILANLLAACAAAPQGETAVRPLRVEYTSWWGDSTIIVAREMGLFEKYGVQVEAVYYDDKSVSLSDLASGTIDGGLFTLGDTLITNDRTPLKLVGAYDNGGFNYIVGAPYIKSPADLEGARIGFNVGSLGEIFIKNTLDLGGLTLRDVTRVDMSAEEVPSNLGTTIDAGYVWGQYATETLAMGGNLLYSTQVAGTFTMDVIVFRTDVVEERPQDIRAFMQAWFEAVDFRIANPDLSNQLALNALGGSEEQISEGTTLFTVADNISLFAGSGPEDKLSLTASLNANIGFLSRQGTLRQLPDLARLLDPSYLP